MKSAPRHRDFMGTSEMARHRLIGLSTAGAALTILALLFHPPAPPWVQTMHLSLEAASFGELNSRASVELGGVKVGTVDGLELRGGRPLIDISVDPTYADLLHGDASAVIRPHGLLGPRYVELDGGSRGRLVDGATIPSSRVHVATDVDLVLNALQPDVRQSLQTLIVELGTASEGRGQDVNATLKSLGDAADDLATVTATLRRRDQDLSGSVVAAERLNRDVQNAPLSAQIQDTNRVLTGLVQVNSSIGHGIDHTATTLQALDVVLDGNSENLSRTLDQAPATVTRLRAVLASATGLVSAVNPTVPSLMTAIVETESSFSGSDANGHFVRVMSLAGSCSVGLNAGCAAPAATATPGQTNTAPSSSVSAPAANPAPIPGPRLSDQELLRLFLGDH
jgi:phospholipid/cholesterol/gamma-HCH transport system substrate-binding protein